jgi:hypothetical protein
VLVRPSQGTRYEGSFRSGLMHGRGKLQLKNGDTYDTLARIALVGY